MNISGSVILVHILICSFIGLSASLRCWDCYSANKSDPCYTGVNMDDVRIGKCTEKESESPACITWSQYKEGQLLTVMRFCGKYSDSNYDNCHRSDEGKLITCGCTSDLCIPTRGFPLKSESYFGHSSASSVVHSRWIVDSIIVATFCFFIRLNF